MLTVGIFLATAFQQFVVGSIYLMLLFLFF